MFNLDMTHQQRPTLEADRALIQSLGGPTQLAKRLGYDKPGSVQRVQNWMARGIPPAVKLANPDLFLAPKRRGGKQIAEVKRDARGRTC